VNDEPITTGSIFAARLRFWLLSGLLIGLGLGAIGLYAVTQTRWGHQQVLGFTLRAAAEQLDGTLEIRRLEGNLLTGARIYGLSLRGPDDEPFVIADSAYLEYSLRSLTGDEIVIDRIVLYDADVVLRRMPGDTLWNFDRIFGDTVPRLEPGTPRRPMVIRSAGVVSGSVTIDLPWEPDPDLTPAARAREIELALAGRGTAIVREAPDGYLRTMRVDELDAELSSIVTAPDEIAGTSLSVDRMTGLIRVFREPFDVRMLQGSLALRDGLLRFRAPTIELPSSLLSAYGRIDLSDPEGLRLDVTVAGDQVAFADLRPIYDRLPDSGGGSLELVVETRPDGSLLVLARDLDVTAPGTRLAGRFGLLLGDALRFVEVDLQADPLRVETIEAMLPTELPVSGLRIGAVEIRQPRS
jgi:hypothetical protein